jgi:hypothetical protein
MKKYYPVLITIVSLSFFTTNKVLSQANCIQPNYCNRICWSPSNNHPPQSSPTYTSPTHMVVHHSGDNQVWQNGTDYAAVVRAYWDIHVNTNGWSDIGYNWLIDRNGVIYEGRGDGVQGAHFSCMNSKTMGACVIGNFNLESPSNQAISSLEDLLAWEASDKDITVMNASYHNNSQLTLNNICGHRDGNASNASQSCASGTVCPGTNLYNSLASIRSSINNLPCYSGSSNTPPNDNCVDAIQLYSDTNCSYSSGTLDNASNDGIDKGSCDDFSNPALAGVFYSFIASNTEHQIYIDNVGTSDIVLVVYNGSNCFNLNEIDCIDPAGSGDIVLSFNTNIGQKYWLRLYDYGFSPPANGNFNICVTHSNAGPQDITVTNATVSPSAVNAGNDVYLECDHNYFGNTPDSELPTFDLEYYLSPDCYLSANDVYLGDDGSTLGSDDDSHNETITVTIPESTVPGQYYILFIGDANDELDESNENNNMVCKPITVYPKSPNAIAEVSSEKVKVYPNPSNGILNIDGIIANELFQITTLSGKIVMQGTASNTLDVSGLSSGMYLFQLPNRDIPINVKIHKE